MFSQDNVYAVAKFHTHIDLRKVKKTLKNNHLCLLDIQILENQRLILTMDSIADLVDLDLIHQYGAITVDLAGSELQQLACLHSNKKDDSIDLDSEISQVGEENQQLEWELEAPQNLKPLNLTQKITKVTSLEDLVQEEQNLRNYFDVCRSTNGSNWTRLWNDQETKSCQTLSSQANLLEKEDDQCQGKGPIWKPVVNGVALTAILVGGFKALSFFFNH